MDIFLWAAIIAIVGKTVYDYIKAQSAAEEEIKNFLTFLESNKPEDYVPEPPDLQLIDKGQQLMRQFFPNGPQARLSSLSLEERKVLLSQFATEVSKLMQINVDSVIFSNDKSCYGFYSSDTNTITISQAYLAVDEEALECVKTIFHEFKHAVQYKAVQEGGNIWGYSDERRAVWLYNFMHYKPAHVSPRLYFEQPVEVDSRYIEDRIAEIYK